jgi:hypothetical protein
MSRTVVRPLDVDALRATYRSARPFPFFVVDDFLDAAFVREVVRDYPRYEDAVGLGHQFDRVNETGKVQVTDSRSFPPRVRELHEAISSTEFLAVLTAITGVEGLVADPKLHGGGMHITKRAGRLDVHADFNWLEDQKLYRRLNILVYLNPEWDPRWGGGLELWDRDVKRREYHCLPKLNRCLLFETTKTSFHGVEKVSCPPTHQRQSFAAYYYTREPPPDWDGTHWSTIFRPRPDERLRGSFLMPAERALDQAKRLAKRVANRIERLRGRA